MPLEAPSPLKLPPHRGEGGLGGGVGERLRVRLLGCGREKKKKAESCLAKISCEL